MMPIIPAVNPLDAMYSEITGLPYPISAAIETESEPEQEEQENL